MKPAAKLPEKKLNAHNSPSPSSNFDGKRTQFWIIQLLFIVLLWHFSEGIFIMAIYLKMNTKHPHSSHFSYTLDWYAVISTGDIFDAAFFRWKSALLIIQPAVQQIWANSVPSTCSASLSIIFFLYLKFKIDFWILQLLAFEADWRFFFHCAKKIQSMKVFWRWS